MKRIAERISRLSLGTIGFFLTNPRMIGVRLGAPSASSLPEIVHAFFPQVSEEEAEEYRRELLGDRRFFEEINRGFIEKRGRRISCEGWPELAYVLTRVQKPEVIVETGIFDGLSSSVILAALEKNKKGELCSVDLPAYDAVYNSTHRMRESVLPAGCGPGWCVPDYLRSRYKIKLGDSRTLLPAMLEEYGTIDLFLHDSLHTYAHQMFEYSTAWPRIRTGGLFLSDDIFWNAAFHRFCRQAKVSYYVWGGFGVAQKP